MRCHIYIKKHVGPACMPGEGTNQACSNLTVLYIGLVDVTCERQCTTIQCQKNNNTQNTFFDRVVYCTIAKKKWLKFSYFLYQLDLDPTTHITPSLHI